MTETIRHAWDLTPTEAIALQKQLGGLVREQPLTGAVRTVAGVDCAFGPGGRQIVAAVVLLAADTLEIIARAYAVSAVSYPYVPGLLSFREAPTELDALAQLPRQPDLLMVDGAGIAHPRRLGIAAHLGLWTGLPTIGVAKSRLCGEHRPVGPQRGSAVQLRHDGQVVGKVVRTRDGVKPLYISIGGGITLDQAVRWTLRLAKRYRLPEPTRQADQMAGTLKRAL